MKKVRLYTTVAALALVFAGGLMPANAANYLEGIGVSRSGDSIVVTISTTSACDYKAFLTEDKPERIVIDLTGVINELPEKQFLDLPLKSIKSIRTSQFRSEPETQARVVLDINRPIDFRNYQSGNSVVIQLPAISDESQFTLWQSAANDKIISPPAPEPVKQVSAPIEEEEDEEVEQQAVNPVEEPAVDSKEMAETEYENDNSPITPAQLAVSDPVTAPGVAVDTSPKRKTIEYTASSLRDPFAPLIGLGAGKIVEGLPSLENLKLVGILEDNNLNRALLEDGEGNGYILKPNDRVQNGYLVTVTESKAVFQVTEYGWTRTVSLELEIPEIK